MKALLSAILSLLIPGLGQVINGHILPGIIWFLVVGAFWAFLPYYFLPTIVHILCAIDAYRSAK